MRAIVKASKLVEIISTPKSVTIDGTAHPKEIFTYWERQALKDIGVYEFIQDTPPDTRFETGGAVSYTVDDKNGIVTEKIAKPIQGTSAKSKKVPEHSATSRLMLQTISQKLKNLKKDVQTMQTIMVFPIRAHYCLVIDSFQQQMRSEITLWR